MSHIKQAKRAYNGELVQGYYRVDRYGVPLIYPHDYSVHQNQKDFMTEAFAVDGNTVEDVAVKPIQYMDGDETVYECPNCNQRYWTPRRIYYCIGCGQRIDGT